MTRIAAVLLCAIALPAAAQQATPARTLPPELRDGRDGLSFGVGFGGGSMGWTHMVSQRTAFTLDLYGSGSLTIGEVEEGDSLVETRDNVQVRASIQPGFRRYMTGRGEVASYFAGNLLIGVEGYYSDRETPTDTHTSLSWAPMGGLGAALGLEWFVTDQLSLRGQIGASAQYSYRFGENVGNFDIQYRDHVVRADFGSSGLAATIWF